MLPRELSFKIESVLFPINEDGFKPDYELGIIGVLRDIDRALNAKVSPLEICDALGLINPIGLNLGNVAAICDNPNGATLYLSILNQLLQKKEIEAQQIFKLISSNHRWQLGAVICHYQPLSTIKEYFNLLDSLLQKGITPHEIGELFLKRPCSMLGKVLFYKDAQAHEFVFNYLEKLIDLGVSLKKIKEILSVNFEPLTVQNFIKFLLQDPARLYRFIKNDLLPDSYYPAIKKMKYRVFDHLKTLSRADMLDACLNAEIKDTPMNKFARQPRHWFIWYIQTRPTAGLFKLMNEEKEQILMQMDQEEIQKSRSQTRIPSMTTVYQSIRPIPVPQPQEQAHRLGNIYPLKKDGEWVEPDVRALAALSATIPPSYCDSSPAIAIANTTPVGQLINLEPETAPAPSPEEVSEDLKLLLSLPPVPNNELTVTDNPATLFAEQKAKKEAPKDNEQRIACKA